MTRWTRMASTLLLVLGLLLLLFAAWEWLDWQRSYGPGGVPPVIPAPLPGAIPDPYAHDGEWLGKLAIQLYAGLGGALLTLGVMLRIGARLLARRGPAGADVQ